MGPKNRNQSVSDDCCPKCKSIVEETEKNSICCKGCESWWHGSCGGCDVKDLPILSKYAPVHWCCSKCEDKHLQGRSTKVWKPLNAINRQHKKETENRKTKIQSMESKKKDLLTIKLKLDNPTSTQPLENYADKVKTNRNETQTKCTTRSTIKTKCTTRSTIKSGTRQNRDPHNILLIKTNQKFRDSLEIKKAFASIDPNKKLLYAFITARGSIHLEFTTPEEADCVWQG